MESTADAASRARREAPAAARGWGGSAGESRGAATRRLRRLDQALERADRRLRGRLDFEEATLERLHGHEHPTEAGRVGPQRRTPGASRASPGPAHESTRRRLGRGEFQTLATHPPRRIPPEPHPRPNCPRVRRAERDRARGRRSHLSVRGRSQRAAGATELAARWLCVFPAADLGRLRASRDSTLAGPVTPGQPCRAPGGAAVVRGLEEYGCRVDAAEALGHRHRRARCAIRQRLATSLIPRERVGPTPSAAASRRTRRGAATGARPGARRRAASRRTGRAEATHANANAKPDHVPRRLS